MKPLPPQAVFLDRDGTLNHDRGYLNDPAQVELIDGVKGAMDRLRGSGALLFLFTNQSAIERGWASEEAVRACNRRLLELLDWKEGFTATCIAPETPEQPSRYRKPSPRFILEMIERHQLDPERVWMVGDKASDILAGERAGVGSVLIDPRGETATQADHLPGATVVVRSLREWVDRVLCL
jgi:D-glycero-D-manno-heptose 1,7-bisphosphate phosphatase